MTGRRAKHPAASSEQETPPDCVPVDPEAQITDYLAAHTAPLGVGEIAGACALSENVARRTLGRLVKTGAAKRAGGGRFTLSAQARKHRTRK